MPRRKLSEYCSKRLVCQTLGLEYSGWTSVDELKSGRYVVKVDQATKKRFKNGLVGLDLTPADVKKWITKTKKAGYEHFIIEPYLEHGDGDERYICLSQTRDGIQLSINSSGGVDVEDNSENLKVFLIGPETNWQDLADLSAIPVEGLKKLVDLFVAQHMTLLEINPYIVSNEKVVPLDVAGEVDDAAILLVDGWKESDLRTPPRKYSAEEKTIADLNESSPASFSFQIINPDGALFVLLSGGGASVTVCDEIYSAGLGAQLANYGEYSGNPTEEETYIYTRAVLQTLLRSKSPQKALFIGGAVANFTDVAKTFAGIIRAIEDCGKKMQEQKIRVVVRRGGPNQEVGLKKIRTTLDKYKLTTAVYGPDTPIDVAVKKMLQEVK